MRKPLQACGKVVSFLLGTLRTTCQYVSPLTANTLPIQGLCSGNGAVFLVQPVRYPSFRTQLNTPAGNLLPACFIHISTAPITMNEKKGLKN